LGGQRDIIARQRGIIARQRGIIARQRGIIAHPSHEINPGWVNSKLGWIKQYNI